MKPEQKAVSLEEFNVHSKFSLLPDRIYMHGHNYPGCIHVHLANYMADRHLTWAGGVGLAVAGRFQYADHHAGMKNAYAVVAGLDEVMQVVTVYDDVVVLNPLGIGLGCSGSRNLVLSRMNIGKLAGELPGHSQRTYFLRFIDGLEKHESALPARKLTEARHFALELVQQLLTKGAEIIATRAYWQQLPVQWTLLMDGRQMNISVEYGTPKISNAHLG